MEGALSDPQILSEPLRRGTPLPLSQLVEESRSRANIPNHLLESKIYAKVQSNSLIQAEPPELHFSGFELGKDYRKILNLINISSEVLNIHIIPTQTKHFQTTYTKKYRLIPGLTYTLKVRFCPDEWRYFYDCIRLHCKGEENLLIPVHAYPVIDDLHIPAHIDLSAVPLGQSVNHAIPLRCTCPIEFEFQVNVIEPHEAFSIHPMAGVIPASGEVKIMVTFCPLQYETSQVTIQLVISQFNTKPYLCTITGSSAPHLTVSQLEKHVSYVDTAPVDHKGPSSASPVLPRSKTKHRSTKHTDRSEILRDPADLKPVVDVCTHAGVAKMLIKDANKISCKALRKALSSAVMVGPQNRQMKEALFMKRVQQTVKEEQANHTRWQVHLGQDPVLEHSRRLIAEEREIALHEYMVKRGDVRIEDYFFAGQPKLSSRRLLCEAGQAPEGAPCFQIYSSVQWELKQRALRLFQQAARKIVIQCRMKRRLTCLKKLADTMRNLPSAHKDEEMMKDLNITSDKVLPLVFSVFPDGDDPLVNCNMTPVPVNPVDVTVTTHIPFFKLQVPQHYKLMGYNPVSTWEAFNSFIPATLARPLRSGPQDPIQDRAQSLTAWEEDQHENQELAAGLTFSAPEALLTPFPANPLRIFNPAPGLQTFKPAPKYLESDPEFHLCPMLRFTVPGSSEAHVPHSQKKLLDHRELIKGVMTWKDFDSVTLNCLSKQPRLTGDGALRRSIDFSEDVLPLTAPPPLTTLPDDAAQLMDKPSEDSGLHLTPEMIRAVFLTGEALISSSTFTTGMAARQQRERQMEESYRSEFNQMGRRVMTRLKELGVHHRVSPEEVCE